MNEETKVKCQDCGFLTADANGERVEIGMMQRRTGERPSSKITYAPVCHEDACPISTEYAPSPEHTPSGERRKGRYLEVIETERVCPKFVPYRPGRTPEQHRERAEVVSDAEAEHMRELTILKWQADEASKAREWQEEQAEIAHRRQEERDKSNRKWQEEQDKKRDADAKFARRWDIAKFFLTAIGAAVAGGVAFYAARHYAEIDRIAAEQRAAEKVQQQPQN